MDINGIEQLITELVTSFLPKVVGVIVLLAAAWIIGGWLSRKIRKSVTKTLDHTIASFLGSLVKYGIIIMAVLGALTMFGFETTSFAALIGAAGLAVGLAMQGTLGNFSAGVMLLIFRPFKVGDVVNVAGTTAKTVEISLFSTEFDTFDNKRVTIPNGKIYGEKIENYTYHPNRRVDVGVGTDYPEDLSRTREVLMGAATSVEGRLDIPEPAVVLQELGGSSIDWSVRVWCNTPDYWDVRDRLVQAVKEALDDAEIGIPYPQMDVHMDGFVTREAEGQA